MKDNIFAVPGRDSISDPLTEMLRSGAQQLIHKAVEAELQTLLDQYAGCRTEDDRAAVVRNGYQPERTIQTGIGPVKVKIPKVRSKTGEPVTFQSVLVPPYVRKTRSLEAAIPWLYLKGISSGEMSEALEVLVGPQASGLSSTTVSRLKTEWAQEYKEWRKESLSSKTWVYVWADGIYSGLRSDEDKLCALVIIGVDQYGQKHFLDIKDGYRESTQSWREVLQDLKTRGMNSPKLAIGDGAMGFWSAMDEVYPDTRHQRCWVHKIANVLNCLPKRLHPQAKEALRQVWEADTHDNALKELDLFTAKYEPKYPKAVKCLEKDRDELLAFYAFPAHHWQSIRTSNPIESTFATIRHRTKRSKGCLSRTGMLHMMFKLSQCAQRRWRKIRGFKELDKVIKGVQFKDGKEVIEKDENAAETQKQDSDQKAA